VRINLSELAGVLDPDGIDDAVVHPELIKDFKQNYYNRSRDRRGMPPLLSLMVGRVREIYKHSASNKEDAVVTRSYRLN
jgi:hypothetical protein